MITERIVRDVVRAWLVWCLVVFAVAAAIGCCGLVVLLLWAVTMTQP